MKPILEQIHIGEQKTISAFRYVNPNFEMPWHFHPQHELTYIETSEGTKFIGDYVGSYKPGELVLLRSNLPHCWKNHVQEHTQSISTVVQWDKGIFTQIPELAPIFDLLKTASKGLIFEAEEVRPLVSILKQLPLLAGHDLYLQLLGLLARLSTCRRTTLSEASFIDDLPSAYSSRMSKVHDFVETEYHRKIYLSEISEVVSMSEQSFSRFFSKMMGRPFFTFLNEYRINVAGRMLLGTDWSVSQIGYSCGYESLPFFHKQFNKFKQESPSRFRRRYASESKGT